MDRRTKRAFIYYLLLNQVTGELKEWHDVNDLIHTTTDTFRNAEMVNYLWSRAYRETTETVRSQRAMSGTEETTQIVYSLFGISYPNYYITFITALCKQMDNLLTPSQMTPSPLTLSLSLRLREWLNALKLP